jgi:hypothetical protein
MTETYNYKDLKSIYRTEDLEESGNKLIYEIITSGSTDIDTNSYLHKMFIKLKLPAIYSSKSRQFRWIKYLGYNIIKEIQLELRIINQNKNTPISINLHTYTEWLFIWNELNLSEEEKLIHNELIGHVPELYDPANANNRNNAYPVSHLNKETYKWIIDDRNTKIASKVDITNDYNYNKPPSIPSRTLYIPLNFYFCNNIEDILPLDYVSFLKINVTFRPVNELYTILLQPEDFVLNSNNQSVSTSNFNNEVKLPTTIQFVNNLVPNFSNNAHLSSNSNIENLSMFDVLINRYEIKPLANGNTSINNFLISPSSDPKNNNVTNINESQNSIIQFYKKNCKAEISYNILTSYKSKPIPYNKKNIILSGLLSDVSFSNALNANTDDNGSVTGASFNITNSSVNEITESFLLFRHSERENKNDLLNFTNLDFNNTLEWDISRKKNNIISYSSDIEILSNSVWEHEATNTSIKLGVDNLGVFYIKKHILDNNIFKYVDIINYRAENQQFNKTSIYNSNSSNTLNHKILDKFKLIVEKRNGVEDTITSQAEPYEFYNRLCVYKNYKNTIEGLYYINNKYKNGIKTLKISLCDYNKLTLNNSDEYKSILFCVEKKEIIINNTIS